MKIISISFHIHTNTPYKLIHKKEDEKEMSKF